MAEYAKFMAFARKSADDANPLNNTRRRVSKPEVQATNVSRSPVKRNMGLREFATESKPNNASTFMPKRRLNTAETEEK